MRTTRSLGSRISTPPRSPRARRGGGRCSHGVSSSLRAIPAAQWTRCETYASNRAEGRSVARSWSKGRPGASSRRWSCRVSSTRASTSRSRWTTHTPGAEGRDRRRPGRRPPRRRGGAPVRRGGRTSRNRARRAGRRDAHGRARPCWPTVMTGSWLGLLRQRRRDGGCCTRPIASSRRSLPPVATSMRAQTSAMSGEARTVAYTGPRPTGTSRILARHERPASRR